MIGFTLAGLAGVVLAWYFFRGGVEGRLQLFLFTLAAGALSWTGSLAARAWGLLGQGVDIVQTVGNTVGNATQLIAPHWPF